MDKIINLHPYAIITASAALTAIVALVSGSVFLAIVAGAAANPLVRRSSARRASLTGQ